MLRWFDEEKERAIEHSFGPLWFLLIPVHVISRTAFFFCLSGNLFSFVLVQEYQSRGFPIVLLFLFAVDYAWTKLKRDDRWPRATQVVKSLIGITGVVAFQKTTPMSGPIDFVIIQFAIMSLIVNLVVESYSRLEITRDKLIYDSYLPVSSQSCSQVFLVFSSLKPSNRNLEAGNPGQLRWS